MHTYYNFFAVQIGMPACLPSVASWLDYSKTPAPSSAWHSPLSVSRPVVSFLSSRCSLDGPLAHSLERSSLLHPVGEEGRRRHDGAAVGEDSDVHANEPCFYAVCLIVCHNDWYIAKSLSELYNGSVASYWPSNATGDTWLNLFSNLYNHAGRQVQWR